MFFFPGVGEGGMSESIITSLVGPYISAYDKLIQKEPTDRFTT